MRTLPTDLRRSFRGLLRTPGFTAAAVLTLALGIGANTAIFSLFNGLLLRPLPVAHPERVVAVYTSDSSGPVHGNTSYPDFEELRSRARSFESLTAFSPTPVSLEVQGEPIRAFAETVAENHFTTLGVRPQLGRAFEPGELHAPVVILSDALWRRRFHADPRLLGGHVRIAGQPFTVVGIAPPEFTGGIRGLGVDLWLPLGAVRVLRPGSDDLTSRGARGLFVFGRLAPGATARSAELELRSLAEALRNAHGEVWTDRQGRTRRLTVVPEDEARIFPQAREAVIGFSSLLLAVVSLVLLVACANVANLFLVRGTQRHNELAVRMALGAKRSALIRQLLVESALVSVLGGALGVLFASWGIDAVMAFRPPVPVPVLLDLTLDARVLAYAGVLTGSTTLLSGLLPALRSTRVDLQSTLKAGGPALMGGGRNRLRSALVVVQVALSFVLLVNAGLFLRSLYAASGIDPGFNPEGVLALSVDLEPQGYDGARGTELYAQGVERLSSLPGVRSAAAAWNVPLGVGSVRRWVEVEGHAPLPGEDPELGVNAVSPGYFRTLEIPLVRGRDFTPADRSGTPGVVIVNESFARRFWPESDAMGRRIRWAEDWLEVVGIAQDSKYGSLGDEGVPHFYFPLLQSFEAPATFLIRTDGDPLAAAQPARAVLQSLDPALPVYGIEPLEAQVSLVLFPARLAATLLGLLGALALVLAAVGLYGVMSYVVGLREHEFGVRLALGAAPRDLVRHVVARGMRLTAAGMAVGWVLAAASSRIAEGFLAGIGPMDPLAYSGVAALLFGVAWIATYLPARRSARADPMSALRAS